MEYRGVLNLIDERDQANKEPHNSPGIKQVGKFRMERDAKDHENFCKEYIAS